MPDVDNSQASFRIYMPIGSTKHVIKETKQKFHQSLRKHSLPADTIIEEAEAFLRSDARVVPDKSRLSRFSGMGHGCIARQ